MKIELGLICEVLFSIAVNKSLNVLVCSCSTIINICTQKLLVIKLQECPNLYNNHRVNKKIP